MVPCYSEPIKTFLAADKAHCAPNKCKCSHLRCELTLCA